MSVDRMRPVDRNLTPHQRRPRGLEGQEPTHGVQAHIDAMKAFVDSVGGTPPQITSHPILFGSGEWTCAVGEFEDGSRMVTVARWRDGAIAEEYIWA